jgi:ABC-type multidrug transport system fused ATPase/permease subunit
MKLRIKPQEKVGIIGPSGGGKSTFVKLLFRFYNLKSGAVYIDRQNIRHCAQESVRRHLSMVPQDPVLFHRSLLENIRYGDMSASEKQVMRAARLSHCSEFIESFPKKYRTLVGERGVKLSGGERQRVAIARAILKNAPILVLDEATSSLDSESERLIQDALANLMKGKTVIVIAHRLSTIMQMDRIIVIDKGAIIEQGTHTELVDTRGSLYHRLWKLQASGFVK